MKNCHLLTFSFLVHLLIVTFLFFLNTKAKNIYSHNKDNCSAASISLTLNQIKFIIITRTICFKSCWMWICKAFFVSLFLCSLYVSLDKSTTQCFTWFRTHLHNSISQTGKKSSIEQSQYGNNEMDGERVSRRKKNVTYLLLKNITDFGDGIFPFPFHLLIIYLNLLYFTFYSVFFKSL